MIPKVIHYCWFGRNPLPELAIKCIKSWKRYLPDYEIKEWNEDNFDVNSIPYIAEAYAAQKYAFVSDYARFWILYKHGGIYFDTDVEVIQPLSDIIEKGPFMGLENNGDSRIRPTIAPGLGIGANPGMPLLKELIDSYRERHFEYHKNIRLMQTVVHFTTDLFIKKGFQFTGQIQCIDNFWIYPSEFFCPINVTTGKIKITKNTRTIHHYAATWTENNNKSFKRIIKQFIPENILLLYSKLKPRNKFGN